MYLYTFISLFIYVVLSVFISLISDTYETLHVSLVPYHTVHTVFAYHTYCMCRAFIPVEKAIYTHFPEMGTFLCLLSFLHPLTFLPLHVLSITSFLLPHSLPVHFLPLLLPLVILFSLPPLTLLLIGKRNDPTYSCHNRTFFSLCI